MDKTNEAIMIVFCSVLLIGVAVAIGALLYHEFGINGPVGAVFAAGLFWAAVSRVRMWL